MKFTACVNRYDLHGETYEAADLAELRELLTQLGAESPEKDSAPVWLPGLNAGNREDADMRDLCAWVLDYDQGEPEWSKLSGWDYIAHTTHSHTPGAPKWRVIVSLGGETYAAGDWKASYKTKVRMHQLSAATDGRTCNPARIWYAPPPGAEWRESLAGGAGARMPPPDPSLSDETPNAPGAARLAGLVNDSDVAIEAAQLYVDHEAPAAIEGEDGSGTTLNVACVLLTEFALADEPAWLLLQRYNDTKCQPQWSDAELRHKFKDAHKDSVHTPGARLDKRSQSEIFESKGIIDPEYAALFVDLSSIKMEPLDWYCEGLGLIPGRPAMLLSYAGTGKSTAGAEIAISAATGKRVFDIFPIKQGRVCMIDNEAARGTQRQVLRLLKGAGLVLPPGQLVMVPRRLKLTKDEDWVWIERIYREFDLVIIDSLHASSPGTDENAVEFAESLDKLATFSERYQRAHLIHHHAGKGDPKKLASQIFGRGTSAIDGSAGAQWAITKLDPGPGVHWRNNRAADGALTTSPSFELLLQETKAADRDERGIPLRGTEGIKLVHRSDEAAAGAGPGAAQRPPNPLEAAVLAWLAKFDRWVLKRELTNTVHGCVPALASLKMKGLIGYKDSGGVMYHRDPGKSPKE